MKITAIGIDPATSVIQVRGVNEGGKDGAEEADQARPSGLVSCTLLEVVDLPENAWAVDRCAGSAFALGS